MEDQPKHNNKAKSEMHVQQCSCQYHGAYKNSQLAAIERCCNLLHRPTAPSGSSLQLQSVCSHRQPNALPSSRLNPCHQYVDWFVNWLRVHQDGRGIHVTRMCDMQKVCGKTFFGGFWRYHCTCMGVPVSELLARPKSFVKAIQPFNCEPEPRI